MKSSYGRLDGIEVLRGFAASGVVFFHTYARAEFQNQDPLVHKILSYFALGVPLFFAISAFSLLYGYSNLIFDEFSIKRFYIRRFFRIAPLFYVLLMVYAAYAYIEWGRIYSASELFTNLTFTYQLIPTQEESIVWAGWTIGIEWIFYFIFPLVALLSRSRVMSVILFLMFLIVSIKFSPLTASIIEIDSNAGYMNTMKHMVYFFLGVVMFCFLPQLEKIKSKCSWISKFDIIIVLAVAVFFVETHLKITKDLSLVLSFIVLMALAVIGFSRVFNNRFTRMLGKLSYGLYLSNPLVIHFVQKIGLYKWFLGVTDSFRLAFIVSCLVSFILVLIVSGVFYYLIEQPGIRLGQRIIDRMNSKRQMESSNVFTQ